MSTRLEILGLAAAAVTAGTIYVLVHEARRKHKKAAKLAAEAPISKEMLLKILNKSADASRAVIDRVSGLRARRRLGVVLTTHPRGRCVADPCRGAQGPAGQEAHRRARHAALPAEL
jgi:hypothetical protein